MLERSVVIYELLSDALARAKQHPQVAKIASLMQAHLADSTHLPDNWPVNARPHTLYLDPMYPHTGKSAAAKKEMQTLKKLLGFNQYDQVNDTKLLDAALHTATQRVVVKRPRSATPITGPKPVGEIRSSNTRYDIYHPY